MKNTVNIIENAYNIGMCQNWDEITFLLYFLKDKNIKNVLEIGTSYGGTFYVWCQIADKKGIKISVDEPQFYFKTNHKKFDIQKRDKRMLLWSDNINIIRGNSHDENIFFKVKKILGDEKLDLLFLDGDHSYKGVKKDYNMYKNLVREDRYIVFHDISDTSFHKNVKCIVPKLWKQIKCKKFEFCGGHFYGGIGVIQKNNFRV